MPESRRLEITGMHCASCAVAVERALRETPGVLDAAVNPATEVARVTLAAGTADGELRARGGAGRLRRARPGRGERGPA